MKKILLILMMLTVSDASERDRALLGCNQGMAYHCSNLGAMYQNGHGGKVDYFRAIEYYKKACNLGNAIGCENLAGIFRREAIRLRRPNISTPFIFDRYPNGI